MPAHQAAARPPSAAHDLLLGLCFFTAASLSAGLTRFQSGVAFIWLANAILLAALHNSPRDGWARRIALCALGSVVATSLFGMGPVSAVPLAILNVAEAAAGAMLLGWLNRGRISLSSGREIAGLLAVAVLVPAATGLPGAAVAHLVTHQDYWENWIAWTSGHALGVLTITPLTLLLLRGDVAWSIGNASVSARLEAVALLLLMIATSVSAFGQTQYPLLFLPFLTLVMCVFRIGRIGATLSLVILTIISAYYTLRGEGPIHLVAGGPGAEAQFLQLYLAVATLVALPAAAELKRRSRLFSELERNAAIHRLIIDRTGDLLMTTDVLGTITYTSPSIRTLTGYGAMELVGRRVRDIVAEQDQEIASVAHATALRDPSRTVMVEYRAHRATGETGWFESHIRAIVSETGETIGAVSIVREISDRKARESDLAAAAATDPLTGLANRRAFEAAYDRLSVAGHGHSIGCLAVFDLDHFKLVNDLHGHAAGDAVLHGFADILAREVRTGDVVARIGGEEFAVILVDANLEQAEVICDRIRRVLWAWSVSAPTGTALRPTVSVGIAPIHEGSTREETLDAADRALYRAKDRGRNRLAIAG